MLWVFTPSSGHEVFKIVNPDTGGGGSAFIVATDIPNTCFGVTATHVAGKMDDDGHGVALNKTYAPDVESNYKFNKFIKNPEANSTNELIRVEVVTMNRDTDLAVIKLEKYNKNEKKFEDFTCDEQPLE